MNCVSYAQAQLEFHFFLGGGGKIILISQTHA